MPVFCGFFLMLIIPLNNEGEGTIFVLKLEL